MIIEIAFIFTAMIVIVVAIRFAGQILGNGIDLALIIPFTNVTPARNFIIYPSIMFQVWFWAERLGVFVNV